MRMKDTGLQCVVCGCELDESGPDGFVVCTPKVFVVQKGDVSTA